MSVRAALLVLVLAACPAPPVKNNCTAPPCEGQSGTTGTTGACDPNCPPGTVVPPPTDAAFGVAARPTNASCTAPARPQPPQAGDMALVKAFPNLTIPGNAGGPTALAHVKVGASGIKRWYMSLRDGRIITFTDANASTFTTIATLTVYGDGPGTNGEGGLLAMAFDPDIETNPARNQLYVHYTMYDDWTPDPNDDEGANFIDRYTITDNGSTVTLVKDRQVLKTGSGGGNHWGGDLKFGPDKFLYASFGDGGNGYDNVSPARTGPQLLSWLRGRIIRIDPRDTVPYAIPSTNPHCLTANCAADALCTDLPRAQLEPRTQPCPETFARGLRNPWRFSFDRTTGQLWIGDVGSSNEEVNLAASGSNHGWPCFDGVQSNVSSGACSGVMATATKRPIAIYRLSGAGSASVLGGHVYRGATFASTLGGTYIFSDVYYAELYSIASPYTVAANIDANPADTTRTLRHPAGGGAASLPRFSELGLSSAVPVISFTEDENGELYVMTFDPSQGGAVLKLALASGAAADPFPARLSLTGCVDPIDAKTPAAGLIPYDLNAPFWSDGAEKARWLALPDGGQITIGADGDWDFPNGTVLMKHFGFAGKLHETRLFMRHSDGGWAGYSYAWNDEQTDAFLVSEGGEQRQVNGQTWNYPSRSACASCHTIQAGGTLGLETGQLNRSLVYPGNLRANQLATLDHIGLFTSAIGDPAGLAVLPPPFGSAPLADRARSYLHTNCQQCHRGAARPDLRYATSLAATTLCSAPALIVPGNAAGSNVSQRMHSTDPGQAMPKSAGTVLDTAGVALVDEWINSLTACP
ncbi:MAG: PQQ-dependent sugar dehydrogenase [Deltaproteobacteria bacterium]|nr:PQQ-dependent sugar dehydrogenase [Deltaproteobacteria bacterium]